MKRAAVFLLIILTAFCMACCDKDSDAVDTRTATPAQESLPTDNSATLTNDLSFDFSDAVPTGAAMIDDFGLRETIIISSFNHYSVKRMQALAPELVYGLLEESRLIDTPGYVAAQGVNAVHPEYHMVDEEFMAGAKRHGLAVNTWTVNSEYAMRRLKALGVNMMIGNYPDLCREILGR